MSPRAVDRARATEVPRLLATVLLPLVAVGPIKRRPRVSAWMERTQADGSTVRTLERLRTAHAGRPVLLRLGPRRLLFVLDHADAAAVLDQSPEPFSPATTEKRAALRHFQPRAVLISPLPARPARRAWNEAALDPAAPVHHAADELLAEPRRAARDLAERAVRRGGLGWDDVDGPLWAAGRALVLGDGARDDDALTAELDMLRSRANLAYLRRVDRRRRDRFTRRLTHHLGREVARGLAGFGPDSVDGGVGQVPHWLFAFDAARMVLWRTLGVLAARPEWQDRVRAEARTAGPKPVLGELPVGRACLLEAARLWPTTVVVLRQTTQPTLWGGGELPAGTEVALVSAYFHRDPRRANAEAFDPRPWLGVGRGADWTIVPFSAGPVACPGRNVVLLAASHLLAELVLRGKWEPRSHPRLARDPVPATLDHTSITVGARPFPGAPPIARAPRSADRSIPPPPG